MPNRAFTYLDLPELDIEDGGMSPDPGREGLVAFSTREVKPLVWNGGVWRALGHADSRLMYGVSALDTANSFSTASGGGEPGINTGYGVATLFALLSRPGQAGLTSRCTPGSGGWSQLFNSAGALFFNQTAQDNTAAYPTINNEIGRIMLAVGFFNATTQKLSQWINGREYGVPKTMANTVAPPVVPQVWGNGQVAGISYLPADAVIYGQLTYRGNLTEAQLRYLFDYTRANNSLPTALPGATVTHRWFVRDQFENRAVANGQTAPATIADSTTNAAVDTLTKSGTAAKLRVTDLGRDGTREFGITQFSGFRMLRSMSGTGILPNSTGFWCACLISPRPYSSAYSTLASAGRIDSQVYWNFMTIWNRKFNFQIVTPGLTLVVDTPDNTMGASDWHQKRLVTAYYDGTNAYVNFDGVNVGSLTMTATPTPPINGVFFIGTNFDGSNSNVDNTIWGVSGGRKMVTLAEVQALAATVKATGRIQRIPGKTDSLWDFTQDMNETPYQLPSTVSGTDAADVDFPLWSVDRIGNTNLRCFGGFRVMENGLVARDNSVGGSGPMTNTFIRSPSYGGGPIPGAASTPWWVELVLYQPEAPWIHGGGEWYACQCDFATTMGWAIHSYARNHFRAVLGAPGGAVLVGAYLPSDLTAGHHVVHLVFTGNQYTLYVDGALRAFSAVGLTHTPDTGDPLMLSGLRRNSTVYPVYNRSIVGLSTGNTAISQEEITAAAAASIAAKQPTGIPSKTSKLWYLGQDIVEAKGRVPNFIKERTADAATDRLVVVGTPLQASMRRERSWGYDKNPIFTGLSGFTAANYLTTANGVCPGFIGGFFITIAYIVYAETTSATAVLASTRSGGITGSGYQLHMDGYNQWLWGQGGFVTDKNTNTTTVTTTNLGRICFTTFTFSQGNQSLAVLYNMVNANGTHTATDNYVPATGTPFTVGGRTDGRPLNDTSVLAVAYGEGHFGQADHAAIYESFMSQEAFPRHKKYKHVWDFHRLIKANNGAIPASFIDSVNGAALTVVGTLSLDPIYHRGYAL